MNIFFKNCLLKEIGVKKQFIIRKSDNIEKSKKLFHKRHLAIFLDSTEQIKEFCALKKSKESVIFRWNFYVEKLCN